MRYEIRPISDRTHFTGHHDYSPFKATWSDTLLILERELTALKAADIVLEVDVTNESQIRLDGTLRADAKTSSPAVRLAFDSRHGPLSYATDRFTRGYGAKMTQPWQHNVRAIALGLEALRKVDRYGITKSGEQYAGWKQLPPGGAEAPSAMTERDAEIIFSHWTGETVWLREDNAKVHRRARAAAHPDRNGGDRTGWDQVEQAAKVLGVIS